jgi:hypothetical protein
MNVRTSPNIGFQTGSTALEPGHQLAIGQCVLLSLLGYNSGAAQLIQIHDAAAAPADGAVPVLMFDVPANAQFSLDTPIKFSNGVYVCNSSTPAVKTAGAANCWFLGRTI